jgi:hypothetical protein
MIGCHNSEVLKGANKYTVELTNKETGRKESQVIVSDKYYEGNKIITPSVYSFNFRTNREYYQRQDKLVELLNSYNSIKYKLLDDEKNTEESKIIQYGYIYSSNVSELESFLKEINKSKYEYHWDFIITNNENEYNSLINDIENFETALGKYQKSGPNNVVYKIDLSSFENNQNAIIENTSKGSSTTVLG